MHLNLTEGYPLSAREDIFTLIGSDGMMLGKADFRIAVTEGFVDLKEVCLIAYVRARKKSEAGNH